MKTKLIILLILNSSFLIPNCITAQMFYNHACRFQGLTSSYIAVKNSTTLNITGSFSVEFWMHPQSITGTQTILSKGNNANANRYGIQLLNGRVAVLTDGVVRVQSDPCSAFIWTHVAATYNSGNHQFKVYINGVLDSSRTDIGAQPNSTTDSMFIGSLPSGSSFLGIIDELRLWNKALSATEIAQFFRSTICNTGGSYSGLIMSMAFQGSLQSGGFDVNDQSGNLNHGVNRGAIDFVQTDRPQHTLSSNEALELDGIDDYVAKPDIAALSPTFAISLECWVYPRNLNACQYLVKGTDYRLGYDGAYVTFMINNNTIATVVSLPLNKWSHLSLNYSGSTGQYKFYLNGEQRGSSVIALGNINNGTDSLFIGGGPGVSDFNGFIDEVRIGVITKSISAVNDGLYQSKDFISNSFINFSFDSGANLFFRNNASLSHPGTTAGKPVSPLVRNDVTDFSQGYYMESVNQRIPSSGTSGSVNLTTRVNQITSISDVNVFVALNHSNISNTEIVLVGPNDDSVKLFDNNTLKSTDNSLVTIFNDQADSSIVNNRYATFSTAIKPLNNLNSVFSGDNSDGIWRLIIRDQVTGDTGRLYAWGIQINNSSQRNKDLNLFALIQGFYDTSLDFMNPDSMTVNLRFNNSPYNLVTSQKILFNKDGFGGATYPSSVNNDQSYYIQLIHRNSIETWSNIFTFINHETIYSFLRTQADAYGGNQILVDNSPVRFAIYGGDVSQDGNVDVSDIIAVFNDVNNVTSGYVNTDVTGDDFVDAEDLLLTHNNAQNLVSVVKP